MGGDLWLCSVEYSACVFGFWGIRPKTPTGILSLDPAGDFRQVLQTPFLPPSKFLATPLV